MDLIYACPNSSQSMFKILEGNEQSRHDVFISKNNKIVSRPQIWLATITSYMKSH